MKTAGIRLCWGALLFGFAVLVEGKPWSLQGGTASAGNVVGNEQRFPVAHAHTASWCVGYLYVSENRVRYEVVQPERDKKHSFDLARSEIGTVQQWMLLGTPENGAEVKTGRGNYHFWLLPKDADLQRGPLKGWGMGNAPPAGPLIAALQGRAAEEVGNASETEANSAIGTGPAPPNVSQGPPDVTKTGPPVTGGATGTPAAASGGRISQAREKVYFGYYSGGTFNPRIEKTYLVFYPSGWVSKNFPDEGLDGFDFAAYMRDPENRNFVGQYRLEGNEAKIVWQDSYQTRSSVEFDDNAAEAHFMGGPYIPLCRCDGAEFSGVYDTGHREPVQFFADGTFEDAGGINSVVGTDLTNPWRGGQGTYSVQEYTLVLNYRDGRRVRKSFTAPAVQEKDQVFSWIAIGGVTFTEAHHQKTQ